MTNGKANPPGAGELSIRSSTAADSSELLSEDSSTWTVTLGEVSLDRNGNQWINRNSEFLEEELEEIFDLIVLERIKASQSEYEWTIRSYDDRNNESSLSIQPDDLVVVTVPEPSAAIALGVLGVGAVASRRRRRS